MQQLPVPARLIELGAAAHRAGRFHEAEVAYRQALEISPENPEALHLLGMLAQQAGESDDAIQLIEQAISKSPRLAAAWNNLGTVHHDLGNFDRADECYQMALEIRTDYPAAHLNRGENFKARGDVAAALDGYRTALKFDPAFREARSNYLAVINYDPSATPASILEEHRRWGPIPGQQPEPPQFTNLPDAERKLKIGYVSPDFRKHAVARFIEPVIANHDPQQFEVHLFAEVPGGDMVTERLKNHCAGYHRTVLRSADDVATQIRQLGIDILIDLAGHTRHNRLDIFAQRPAPIQMTYLGVVCTTGVPEIDYIITDSILDPPGESLRTTERLLRLPGCFASFQPPERAPEITPTPASTGKPFTFGSHHQLIKLNDNVLRLWKDILDTVSDSRLAFIRSEFRPSEQDRFRDRLSKFGFDLSRVEFNQSTIDEADYLAAIAGVDVILDCFPFTGHTMTCEALWMGLPIVTLRGNRANGRLSASVLTQIGLPELIADSTSDYVRIAATLAGNVNRVAQLRRGLRRRMTDRLCDGHSFTRDLEKAYRAAWQTWCEQQPPLDEKLREVQPMANAANEDPNDIGVTLAKAGRFDEARAMFEQALQKQPDRTSAAFNLALALDRLNRWDDAVRAYERAIRLGPTDAVVHRQLAMLLQRMGRSAEADVSFRNAQRWLV